ncbi:MAG: MAPEG family protein [Sulfuriflexus sp.]|nr:MAPEG family protein [Sulfuriflexus sp.]
MDTAALIIPTAVLVSLTYIVSLSLVFYRFYLVKTGAVHPGYFKLHKGGKPPKRHEALEHNYSNLFEVPTLFYAIVAIAIASQHIDETLVTLAWIFVGLRIAHTLVHISYNNIIHRLAVFFAAYVAVGIMWFRVVSDILQTNVS